MTMSAPLRCIPYSARCRSWTQACPFAGFNCSARRFFRTTIRPALRRPAVLLAGSTATSQPIPPWPLSNVPIMLKRCTKSTQPSSDASTKTDEKGSSSHDHPRDGHTHSHSIFHTHSHDEHAHGHDAEEILKALQGAGDRGSRITLIGLYSNIVLTGAKGIAAWYMNSASLLADAGHSLSDLLGDFVTLFCWKLSRKPPSNRYPYGFAKFETLGTTTVSLMLVGGALGIGFHFYHLLVQALATSIPTLPPGPLYDILSQVTSVAQHAPSIGHVHGHHGGALDPNAAWFAAISILAKEWLYRITKKVADEEHSPVLYANAVHHRSDAYSSVVALVSILGSWLFSALPLDPIGGMLVSVVILQQGYTLLKGAFAELTDAGVSKSIHEKLLHALGPLLSEGVESGNGVLRMLAIRHLRAKHTGSLILVDVTVDVPSTWTVLDTSTLEEQISCRLKTARTEVSDVRVKFCPVDVELES